MKHANRSWFSAKSDFYAYMTYKKMSMPLKKPG